MALMKASRAKQLTDQIISNTYDSAIFQLEDVITEHIKKKLYSVQFYVGNLSISDRVLLIEHLKIDYGYWVKTLYNKPIADSEVIEISWN